MKLARVLCSMSLPIVLGACLATGPGVQSSEGLLVPVANIPDGVLALADPTQDLTTVRINPKDDCYWYQYVGPVETTYLPLRSPQGNPICKRLPT